MPVELQLKKNNGGLMAVWRINEPEEELAEMIPFNSEMKSQLNRFTCPSRRLEWLASRALIYQLTGCVPLVEYTKIGQPFVQQSDQNISISHTRGFAAVSISPSVEAGIDIEYPSKRISHISSRFINPAEEAFLPDDNTAAYHALIWCAKETLFKMAAQPGLIFKNDILVSPFVAGKEGTFSAKLFLKNNVKEFQLLYKLTTDYYLVWHF